MLAVAAGLAATPVAAAADGAVATAYSRLPLAFAPNGGQTDRRVRFVAQAGGSSMFFTRRSLTLAFAGRSTGAAPFTAHRRGAALRLRFIGADPRVRVRASSRRTGTLNLLDASGRVPARSLPTFGKLTYENLWPGIDLVFRGRRGVLKYEFAVAAGADVRDIRLAYDGIRRLTIGSRGRLRAHTPAGVLSDARPVSFQRVGERRARVRSRFVLRGAGYGFALGAGYRADRAVVIDPGLQYATFLGGSNLDAIAGIAVDDHGSAYVAGDTSSLDFPTTPGALQPAFETGVSGSNSFLTKFDAAGHGLVYSTYMTFGYRGSVSGLAVDSAGSAYLSATSANPDYVSGLAVKVNPQGSGIDYVAGIFGDDTGGVFPSAIAVDDHGGAYMTGYTGKPSFTTTPGAFDETFNGPDGSFDGFVVKVAPNGAIAYSTILGGAGGFDGGGGIAVDAAGRAYVIGVTQSTDFPSTPQAWMPTFGGNDPFLTRLDPAGASIEYSTSLGGLSVGGVAADDQGSAYVTGSTAWSGLPTTPGAPGATLSGPTDAFIAKLTPAGGGLAYATYLGGSGDDAGSRIDLGPGGSADVVGSTGSTDFPTTPQAHDATFNGGGSDAFVTTMSPAGTSYASSTFLGGSGSDGGAFIAVDPAGAAYVAGTTRSADFPTTAGAFDRTDDGDGQFVAKLGIAAPSDGPCSRPGVIHGAGPIQGTPGDDVICGSPGRDQIRGAGGKDTIFAGQGDDEVNGGSGDDRLSGGQGDDALAGGNDADRLFGEDGRDLLAGDGGAPDRCDGGGGIDRSPTGGGCEIVANIP